MEENLPALRLEEHVTLHVRDVVAVVAEYSCQGDVTQLNQLFYNKKIIYYTWKKKIYI